MTTVVRGDRYSFGASVGVTTGFVAVGEPADTSDGSSGRVYVFRSDSQLLRGLAHVLLPPPEYPDPAFGASVALAGDVLAVGSPSAMGGRGAVHFYSTAEEHVLGPESPANISVPLSGPTNATVPMLAYLCSVEGPTYNARFGYSVAADDAGSSVRVLASSRGAEWAAIVEVINKVNLLTNPRNATHNENVCRLPTSTGLQGASPLGAQQQPCFATCQLILLRPICLSRS